MVFVEGGFAWVPNLMYTMDTHWRNLRREVPWVKRPPSQQSERTYVVWNTTIHRARKS